MIIRSIEEKDINKCLEIYNYYILNTTVTFEETVLAIDEFKSRVNRITSLYPFLVLENDNTILGYVYLDKFSDRSAYRYTCDLSIYLKNDTTNKGYGKLLLEEIEVRAKDKGIKNLISIITKDNKVSLNFHEANGFTKQGELINVGYKFNKCLSILYYQKSL